MNKMFNSLYWPHKNSASLLDETKSSHRLHFCLIVPYLVVLNGSPIDFQRPAYREADITNNINNLTYLLPEPKETITQPKGKADILNNICEDYDCIIFANTVFL